MESDSSQLESRMSWGSAAAGPAPTAAIPLARLASLAREKNHGAAPSRRLKAPFRATKPIDFIGREWDAEALAILSQERDKKAPKE
jgi:hypothetical protein